MAWHVPGGLLALLVAAGALVPPAAARAQTPVLGRLFTTPAERRTLDEARRRFEEHKTEKPTPAHKLAVEKPKEPVVPEVSVGGVVLRSDGHDVAWINGASLPGGTLTPQGIRVVPSPAEGGSVRIELPDGGKSIDLRPGQKIDLLNGDIFDAYQKAPVEGAKSAFGAAGAAPGKALAGSQAGPPAGPKPAGVSASPTPPAEQVQGPGAKPPAQQ